MSDAALLWSSDLGASATGDIAMSSGEALGQERLLRRLLTNPGDYLWQPGFGAGLGEFVGAPCDVMAIKARIRSQIFLESTVLRTPEPVVDVESSIDGGVYVHIQYVQSQSGISQVLSFMVNR